MNKYIKILLFFKQEIIWSVFLIIINYPVKAQFTYDNDGIIRGDTSRQELALIFTGGHYAYSGYYIRTILKTNKIPASFFFTGNFYRHSANQELIKQLIDDGHYLGPHSDKHLLYCDWKNRDSVLISKMQFKNDISENYKVMAMFNLKKEDAKYFVPPYEWYNNTITAWAKEMNITIINFTPGTYSNSDYTTPSMPNYRSSEFIFRHILSYERNNPNGLNGFLLLLHIGTHLDRTDKFYYRLEELITILIQKGYVFKRVDALLD